MKPLEYKWRDGFVPHGADPQKVGVELLKLGRNFTAHDVVEKAQDPDSALHSLFEWDDTKAATQYRLYQSRVIVASLQNVVVIENKKECVRGFINFRVENKKMYVPIATAVKSDEIRAQMINKAYSELQAFQRKYRVYSELEEVAKDIGKILVKLKK